MHAMLPTHLTCREVAEVLGGCRSNDAWAHEVSGAVAGAHSSVSRSRAANGDVCENCAGCDLTAVFAGMSKGIAVRDILGRCMASASAGKLSPPSFFEGANACSLPPLEASILSIGERNGCSCQLMKQAV